MAGRRDRQTDATHMNPQGLMQIMREEIRQAGLDVLEPSAGAMHPTSICMDFRIPGKRGAVNGVRLWPKDYEDCTERETRDAVRKEIEAKVPEALRMWEVLRWASGQPT